MDKMAINVIYSVSMNKTQIAANKKCSHYYLDHILQVYMTAS